MKLGNFQSEIFFSTARISLVSDSGASIGTGFLCRVPITEHLSYVFCVSNRHVLGDPSGEIRMDFHLKGPDGMPVLGQRVPLGQSDFSDHYFGHPDPEVDLACVNATAVTNEALKIFYRSVGPDQVASFEEIDLTAGAEVWFVGYPEDRFDVVHNLPILRRGYIASLPTVDFNGRPEFVIDAEVFPGSSGSPVFAGLGSTYQLIGVVTQTMVKDEQLRVLPAQYGFGVQHEIGLGIVIKATEVTRLLDHARMAVSAQLVLDASFETAPVATVEVSEAEGDTHPVEVAEAGA